MTYKPKYLITRGDKTYSIKKIEELSKDIDVELFNVEALKWNLEYISKGEDHDARVAASFKKTIYPIYVYLYEDECLDVLDGLHRLQYAVNKGFGFIYGKLIPKDVLSQAEIKDDPLS